MEVDFAVNEQLPVGQKPLSSLQRFYINIVHHSVSGCGTGKYLGLAPESFVIGSDSCVEFVEIAVQRGHNVVACDNQSLPFRESCFDAVISVGVIHHFASGKRRSKALEELYRILRPGGRMLVYVWAFEQEQRKVCNWWRIKGLHNIWCDSDLWDI